MDMPPSRRNLPLRGATLAAALCASLPCAAQSLRVDYQVGLWAMHTDNVNLVETDEDSETLFAPTLVLDASKESSTVQLRARGRFQHLDYRSGAYEDETVGDFAGQLNWFLVPDRFALVFADYLGRTPIDITGGLTPGNQQQINVFTAGPTLFLRPTETTRAQIDLRFADTRSDEVSDFDGTRYTGALRLLHDLSPIHGISANVEASDVDFDAAPGTDYKRYDGYVGYFRQSDRIDLQAAAGYSRIERQDVAGTGLDETLSGPLARLEVGWQVAARSRINILGRYEFADSATDLVARSGRFDEPMIEDLASPNVAVGAGLFRSRRLDVGYQYQGERLRAYLAPYVERVSYEQGDGAYWNAQGIYLDLRYQVHPRLDLQAWALTERRDIMDAREDRDWTVRAGVSYEFSRHLVGFAGAQRRERDSNVAGEDYRENLAMLSISYRR